MSAPKPRLVAGRSYLEVDGRELRAAHRVAIDRVVAAQAVIFSDLLTADCGARFVPTLTDPAEIERFEIPLCHACWSKVVTP